MSGGDRELALLPPALQRGEPVVCQTALSAKVGLLKLSQADGVHQQ